MSDLEANYCQACGEPVKSAHAIHADSTDPFPPAATGTFAQWPEYLEQQQMTEENVAVHVQVGEREVRVFVHENGGDQ